MSDWLLLKEELLTPVTVLKAPRVVNGLMNAGIVTIAGIYAKGADGVRGIDFIGKKSIAIIDRYLESRNLPPHAS